MIQRTCNKLARHILAMLSNNRGLILFTAYLYVFVFLLSNQLNFDPFFALALLFLDEFRVEDKIVQNPMTKMQTHWR